jgi:hypothetical protein
MLEEQRKIELRTAAKGLLIGLLAAIALIWLLLKINPTPVTPPGTEHVAVAPKVWKDKDSATHTVSAPIIASDPGAFLKIEAQEAIIKSLQSEVSKYKKQLGKSGSVTVVQGTNSVDTMYVYKSVPNPLFIWQDSLHNKYLDWSYKVEKDSAGAKAHFKLKTVDDLVIVNRVQSNGWFKGHTVVTEVVNKNPYSKTVNSATFNIDTKVPRRPWSIGPYVGYGFGDGITPNVSVGIGLQYGFIRF